MGFARFYGRRWELPGRAGRRSPPARGRSRPGVSPGSPGAKRSPGPIASARSRARRCAAAAARTRRGAARVAGPRRQARPAAAELLRGELPLRGLRRRHLRVREQDDGSLVPRATTATASSAMPSSTRRRRMPTSVAVGFWHACASGSTPTQPNDVVYCWGRDDAGQLGAPAPDVCDVDGREIPCARKPQGVPFELGLRGLVYAPNHGPPDLRAGDLFTCARTDSAIVCWGASRDRFFGEHALCPEGLRHTWPRLSGESVAAPRPLAPRRPPPSPAASGSRRARTCG
jgi:hypothetical protein